MLLSALWTKGYLHYCTIEKQPSAKAVEGCFFRLMLLFHLIRPAARDTFPSSGRHGLCIPNTLTTQRSPLRRTDRHGAQFLRTFLLEGKVEAEGLTDEVGMQHAAWLALTDRPVAEHASRTSCSPLRLPLEGKLSPKGTDEVDQPCYLSPISPYTIQCSWNPCSTSRFWKSSR